uniref:hypothetical protein n=1 Tax=Altererythrobacter segetis TaxID=1104773 RepID=UPI001409ADF5|nr:hypothetical protein [Altererythrobacter segetis]
MKPRTAFAAPLALAALAWAAPALAGHPPHSPLAEGVSGGWMKLGTVKASADEPAFTVYVNVAEFDPADDAQHHLRVHEWEVYDQPLAFPGGTVVEVGYEYLLDCVRGKFDPEPSLFAYGADGELVFAKEGNTGGEAKMVDIPANGLESRMAGLLCD